MFIQAFACCSVLLSVEEEICGKRPDIPGRYSSSDTGCPSLLCMKQLRKALLSCEHRAGVGEGAGRVVEDQACSCPQWLLSCRVSPGTHELGELRTSAKFSWWASVGRDFDQFPPSGIQKALESLSSTCRSREALFV